MLVLHHAWRSSASRRVRLCLAEKGLEFESRLVDMMAMEHHSPEYLKINPLGVIPTLMLDDGRALYESGTICEYLDDTYPDPPLRPADPYERAVMRNWPRSSRASRARSGRRRGFAPPASPTPKKSVLPRAENWSACSTRWKR